MKKKDASFWSDIKVLDERLKRDPDSFCFARLSEIYLKVGLVSDALHAARTGVSKHPGYLAGQRALAMACNASGLTDESRIILENVTAAMPEDVDVQKILAKLYVAAGDNASAIRTYQTVLDFRPDDKECALELEALQHASSICSNVDLTCTQIDMESGAIAENNSEDEIIELSESDIIEEELEAEISLVTTSNVSGVASVNHDPLSTLTLAELYEKQGFLTKAREIYQTVLAEDPGNTKLLAKIAQLEDHEPAPVKISEDFFVAGFDEEPASSEPEVSEDELSPMESQSVGFFSESISGPVEPEFFAAENYDDVSIPLESKPFAPLSCKAADNIVDTLGDWLENIRRIKACR